MNVLQQSNVTRVWSVIQPVPERETRTNILVKRGLWTEPDPRDVRAVVFCRLQLLLFYHRRHFFISFSVLPESKL